MAPLLLLAACAPPEQDDGADPPGQRSTLVARLENPAIDEASGLTRSQRRTNLYWIANDDGPPVLYAIDGSGRHLGRTTIKGVRNRDWEDLASFTLEGVPYLIVADIGDNDAQRDHVRLIIVEEPATDEIEIEPAWQIEFSYPDGPRDAESLAVDAESREIYVLSKRDLPPRFYTLPIIPDDDQPQTATKLDIVARLPRPSRQELESAPRTDNWSWQPTGMDIAADGKRAVVLTYGGVYLYEKSVGDRWTDAFRSTPTKITRTGNRTAESITFDALGDSVYITLERRNAPLYRVPVINNEAQ